MIIKIKLDAKKVQELDPQFPKINATVYVTPFYFVVLMLVKFILIMIMRF